MRPSFVFLSPKHEEVFDLPDTEILLKGVGLVFFGGICRETGGICRCKERTPAMEEAAW